MKYRTIIVIDHTAGDSQQGFTIREYCDLTEDQIKNGELYVDEFMEMADSWTVTTTSLDE